MREVVRTVLERAGMGSAVMRVGLRIVPAGVVAAAGLPCQASAAPVIESAPTPKWIQAGPMIGHVGAHEIRVWVRFAKRVDFQVRGTVSTSDGPLAVRPARVEKLGDRIRRIEFNELPADSEITVQIFRGRFPNRGVALAVRTAPESSMTGTVRIGFGSCCNDIQFPKTRIYTAIADERPDLFLFTGNATYFAREYTVEVPRKRKKPKIEVRIDTLTGDGDWLKRGRMFDRHLRSRKNPLLQPLLRSVACYSIWGESDYGHQGADQEFAGKKKSLKVFAQMWANPSFGTAAAKGCFSSFRRGPVEFFLLDGRYHRSVAAEIPERARTIWGPAQFRWLCAGLKASSAPVKILVTGSPVLGGSGEGHSRNAPGELAKLLAFLDEQGIGGVVILSGGPRQSEVVAFRRQGRPTLLEFSSAPLSWGQKPLSLEATPPRTVWKRRGDSYGLVTVAVDGEKQGTITFEVRDEANRIPEADGVLCRATWQLGELTDK